MESSKYIYHIASKEDWNSQHKQAIYTHPSLTAEGFIHCSTWEQIPATLNRFFQGNLDVFILKIIPEQLDVPLKFEAASGNAGIFPHIFGPIPKSAICEILTRKDINK